MLLDARSELHTHGLFLTLPISSWTLPTCSWMLTASCSLCLSSLTLMPFFVKGGSSFEGLFCFSWLCHLCRLFPLLEWTCLSSHQEKLVLASMSTLTRKNHSLLICWTSSWCYSSFCGPFVASHGLLHRSLSRPSVISHGFYLVYRMLTQSTWRWKPCLASRLFLRSWSPFATTSPPLWPSCGWVTVCHYSCIDETCSHPASG